MGYAEAVREIGWNAGAADGGVTPRLEALATLLSSRIALSFSPIDRSFSSIALSCTDWPIVVAPPPYTRSIDFQSLGYRVSQWVYTAISALIVSASSEMHGTISSRNAKLRIVLLIIPLVSIGVLE